MCTVHREARNAARLSNGHCTCSKRALAPLPDAAGSVPPAFPATVAALERLEGAPLAALVEVNGVSTA